MRPQTPIKIAQMLRDPVPVRLGGLAADLARIGSASSNVTNSRAIQILLEEARRFIEWTAAELEVEAAGNWWICNSS